MFEGVGIALLMHCYCVLVVTTLLCGCWGVLSGCYFIAKFSVVFIVLLWGFWGVVNAFCTYMVAKVF